MGTSKRNKDWFETMFSSHKEGVDRYFTQIRASQAHRFRLCYNFLKPELTKSDSENFVDIGCGLGDFTEQIRLINPKNTFNGVDISQNAVDGGNLKYPNIKFKLGQLPDVKFEEQFKGIFTMEVVNYLDSGDRDKTFQNIYNGLKPGGFLFFTTALYKPKEYFYEDEAISRIENAGFTIERKEYNYSNIYYKIEGFFVKILFHQRSIKERHFIKGRLMGKKKMVAKLIKIPIIGHLYKGMVWFGAFLARSFVKASWIVRLFQKIGKMAGRSGKSHLLIIARKS